MVDIKDTTAVLDLSGNYGVTGYRCEDEDSFQLLFFDNNDDRYTCFEDYAEDLIDGNADERHKLIISIDTIVQAREMLRLFTLIETKLIARNADRYSDES